MKCSIWQSRGKAAATMREVVYDVPWHAISVYRESFEQCESTLFTPPKKNIPNTK